MFSRVFDMYNKYIHVLDYGIGILNTCNALKFVVLCLERAGGGPVLEMVPGLPSMLCKCFLQIQGDK